MRKSILLNLIFLSSIFINGFAQSSKSTVDAQKNVVFTTILENLPANDEEILLGVTEYLKNSYKDTRYTISTLEPQSGLVIGDGQFNSFFQSDNLVRSCIFNLPFQLRVDTKGNRARIQFISRNYEIVELSDMADKKKTLVLICEADNSKMYKKAFQELENIANKTINQLSEAIKTMRAKPAASDDW